MLSNNPLNPVDESFYRFLVEDEKARQRAIRRARAYVSGQQFVLLDDRLREFLADPLARGSTNDADFLRLNLCHTVVRAVTERLMVKAFVSANTALQEYALNTWQRNRMDARADDVHDMAVRDGECYVLISYDDVAKLSRFTPHPRYVEADYSDSSRLELDGDGYGIKAFYQDDDDNNAMLYAVKRWTEVTYKDGKRITRQRATIYYPERVEKYEVRFNELVRIQDKVAAVDENGETVLVNEVWPLPWLDATGKPLGVPVAHFKNANLSSEATEAIPLQNAVNKILLDLLQAEDIEAFRLLFASGWKPESANGITKIVPGVLMGSNNPDARLQSIDGTNLTHILEVLDSLILKVAQVTDTPSSRFITTKAVAAEGTLKQQDAPLLAKIKKRHALLGNAWEDAYYIARRLENTFGDAALDETALLTCEWENPQTRDDTEELVRAEARMRVGVPQEQIWRELGYSEELIARWLVEKKQREQQELAAAQQARAVMPVNQGTI